VPVSRASAAAILIGVRRDLDRFTHLGFSAQGVPNEDAEAMRGALERWFPQWRQ
jgi:hypothetical protein